ncbi:AraC family transcriptional regulator [Alcanivorax sp. JB21]|uniref:helix-turn-helix transcriptional regulator n=1 Tax=Alcanivorax limicola TaxID=2874102 RepID=UPI001CC142EE|nr:AraC family transcriptional regulator [Alcanivorax limicola]MBZ2187688.1 AraC family transcriptional regulator [Alcanivorax limicola]
MHLTKHPALLASDLRYWVSHGLSLAELGAATGASVSDLTQDSERADAALIYRLYTYTSNRLHDPCMGLRIGHQTLLSDIAPLLPLIHHSQNGWQMLHHARQFWPLLTEADRLEVLAQGETCRVQVHPVLETQQHPQQTEAMINGILRLGGVLLGIDRAPDACLRLRRAQPAQPHLWRELSGVPVHFGCEVDEICFSRHILDQPNPASESAALDQALLQARRELGILRQRFFSDDITVLIRDQLPRGNMEGVSAQRQIAELMHISVRGLQRRLQAQNTSFRRLVDQVRAHRARELISEGLLSQEAIAQQLGYTETGTLCKAFRRWTGMTPGEYRASHPWSP